MGALRPNGDKHVQGFHDPNRGTTNLYTQVNESSLDTSTFVTTDTIDPRYALPNGVTGVLVIMTDDEDEYSTHAAYLGGRAKLQSYLVNPGCRFPNMIGVHSLCAPTRATAESGQHQWNNGSATAGHVNGITANQLYNTGTARTAASVSVTAGGSTYTDAAATTNDIGRFITPSSGETGLYVQNVNAGTHLVTVGGGTFTTTATISIQYVLGRRAANAMGPFKASTLFAGGDIQMDFDTGISGLITSDIGGTGRRTGQRCHLGKLGNGYEGGQDIVPSFVPPADRFMGFCLAVDGVTQQQAYETVRDDSGNVVSQGMWPALGTLSDISSDGYQYMTDIMALRLMRFIDECRPYDAVNNPIGRQPTDKRYGLPWFATFWPSAPHAADNSGDPKVLPAPTVGDPDYKYKNFLYPHSLDRPARIADVDRFSSTNLSLVAGASTFTDSGATASDVGKMVYENTVTDGGVLRGLWILGVSGSTVTLSGNIGGAGTTINKVRYGRLAPQLDPRVIETGTFTTVTATGATKTGAAWTTALVGRMVLIGNRMARIASVPNATTLTFDTRGWHAQANGEAATTPTSLSYTIGYGFMYPSIPADCWLPTPNALGIDMAKSERLRYNQLVGVDDALAAVCDFLSSIGQLETTLIIYLSDNGVYRGNGCHWDPSGKDNCFDTDLRIVCIARGPGIPAGATNNAQLNSTNIYPTIARAFGLSRSVYNRSVDSDRTIFDAVANPTGWDTEVVPGIGSSPQYMVRTRKWKYYEDGGAGSLKLKVFVSGGTGFTLSFLGQTTGTISPTATGADVSAALDALSNLASTDIVVATISGGWTVEFAHTAGNVDGTYGGSWIVDPAGNTLPLVIASLGGGTGHVEVVNPPQPAKVLYNMEDDPFEMHNLATQGTPTPGSVQATLADYVHGTNGKPQLPSTANGNGYRGSDGPLPTFSG